MTTDMTQGQKLEQWYIKNYGELKAPETITDVIAKGKTLIYGNSGAGKTYSTVKHLNKNKIIPILLDFDNNPKIDDLEFSAIDGGVFVNQFRGLINQDYLKEEKELIKNKLKKLTTEYFTIYKTTINPTSETHKLSVPSDKMMNTMFMKYPLFDDLHDELMTEMREINEKGLDKDSIFFIQKQVIIIDTCAKALTHFETFEKFELFINVLLRFNNDIILIAHTHNQGNKQVPDLDEVFANHCDCKLKLNNDITKTKGSEVYLTVEKLRGYKGDIILKNWER